LSLSLINREALHLFLSQLLEGFSLWRSEIYDFFLEHLSWVGALYGGIRIFVYGWFILDIWWIIFGYKGFACILLGM
jgi:hypothetical protein